MRQICLTLTVALAAATGWCGVASAQDEPVVDADGGDVVPTPVPTRQAKSGLGFERNVTTRQRRAVRAAVRRANPSARRLIGRVQGFTTVRIMPGRDTSGIGLAGPDDKGGWHVDIKAAVLDGPAGPRNAAVLHELGHIVQMSGIRGRALRRLDRTIPKGGRCPAYDPEHPVLNTSGPCATTRERIADTFAKWALRLRRLPGVGYEIATPRSFRPFARIITRAFDYRPSF